jgi:hypothetical protein
MRTLFSYPCINQLLDAVVCGVKLTGCSIGFAAGAEEKRDGSADPFKGETEKHHP